MGRGGLARGIHDPILSETSLIRPTSPHALLSPVVHQGKSLGEGVPRSSPQGSHRTGPSDSRLLQSPIRGPEGLRVLVTHHRPVYPEHIHSVTTVPYGDSSVRPTLYSPRRLDDLIGSAGRLPSSSNPPGITSVSCFTMGGVPYQFRVLCFGLTTAPQVFTRLMAPISAILHRYGIRILRYLDDWLILAESRTTCIQARDRLLHLCEELGLQVNHRKSSLVPSQDMTYLGMQILSVRFIGKPTETIVNLLNIIEEFLSSPDPPAALWRRLLGHLSSLTLLVKGGMLRMRSLQLRLRSKWIFRDDYLHIPWDPLCQEDLLWWSGAIQQRQGVDLSLPVPDLSFYSDASDVGWGAIMGEQQVSGVWTPSQKQMSINLREMMAVQNGLLGFSQFLGGKTIALFCDNITTVAYLRLLGGTRSKVLFLKAREILLWVESMKITILPHFIQGSLNTRADLLSRPNLVIFSEWTLHHQVVQDLLHQWPAIIDLFATSLTARLPVFFAPAWEPKATGVDAFLQPWDNLQAYAFPPIAIIRRVLLKLRASHNCDLTLIAPFWPQREWFPDLLELLSDIQIELPKRQDLLRQLHFHRFHENLQMLRLTAWRLSSDSHDKQASLKQWLANLPSVGEHLLD